MKVTIKETTEPGWVQITTLDERWYLNNDTGGVFPSVTWIASCYPKTESFNRWLASKGWDEAEQIKMLAGDKGSRVHKAIDMLICGMLKGEPGIEMNMALPNESTGQMQEFTPEEWGAAMSFVDWWEETKPVVVSREKTVINDGFLYAGTVDLHCLVGGEEWIVDFKTSKDIYPSHEIQVSAYKQCGFDPKTRLGILQIGYQRNKKHWKFTELEDKFDLFLAARRIWQNENPEAKPKQMNYPVKLSLTKYGE